MNLMLFAGEFERYRVMKNEMQDEKIWNSRLNKFKDSKVG